jgi:uncharacterized membrane-anchored protein
MKQNKQEGFDIYNPKKNEFVNFQFKSFTYEEKPKIKKQKKTDSKKNVKKNSKKDEKKKKENKVLDQLTEQNKKNMEQSIINFNIEDYFVKDELNDKEKEKEKVIKKDTQKDQLGDVNINLKEENTIDSLNFIETENLDDIFDLFLND